MKFQKTILFLRIHLRLVFLCLISLVSSFAKEETRETRRKEKKEERLPRSRLPFDKIPLRPARWILSALMRDLRSFYVREFGRSKSFAPNSLVLWKWWVVIVRSQHTRRGRRPRRPEESNGYGILTTMWWTNFYNVGATTNEQARRRPLASLREGGGFCVAKDGRSLRYVRFE